MGPLISALQTIYSNLGITISVNEGDIYGLGSTLALLLLGFLQFKSQKPSEKGELGKVANEPIAAIDPLQTPKVVSETKTIPFSERLKKGLSRSRAGVWGRIGSLLSSQKLNADTLEELEELLYGADIGPTMAGQLIEEVENQFKNQEIDEQKFKKFLFNFLSEKMTSVQSDVDTDLYKFNPTNKGKTKVIMVVGVNGAGKTTTIGKLATKLTEQGAKVVVGACDTFRAAAVDQLQVWCDRAGAKMVRAAEGSNPSGVGFESLQMALNENADYCILDTAGRLHTKGNLMEELKKSKNVLKKLDETAPHQTLLVIDAITGQNAMRQAQEFHKTLELDGLILTKCDGSSKAGSAVAIVQGLNVPIVYIGVGESVEDLDVFHLDQYLNALLDSDIVQLN
jgi:fused signal recognition particle receptor